MPAVADWVGRAEWVAALAILLAGLALRRPFWSALVGAVKAALGCLMLSWAALGPVRTALGALEQMGQGALHLRLVLPVNELAMLPLIQRQGAATLGIFFLGAGVMLLLARVLPRVLPRGYVFLSGHHSLFMAALLAGGLVGLGLSSPALVMTGGVVLGLLQALGPALAQPLVRRLTGEDAVGLAHFSLLSYWVATTAARRFAGRKSVTVVTERPETPGGITALLQEPLAGTAVLSAVVFLLLGGLERQPGWISANLYRGLLLGVGLAAAAYGARLLLGEWIPLLQTAAERFAPRAVPALDVPALFPYTSGLLLPGFLASFAAGLLGMALQAALGLPLIVPSIVPHYFTGAAAAGFGAAYGGRRGALVGAFANGLVISTLAVPLYLLQPTGLATTFSDADFQLVGIVIGLIRLWGED
jgi:PTS system ascorbate-specific IIC component